jgi:hypothetical protein
MARLTLRASEAVALATFAAREGRTMDVQEQATAASECLTRLHQALIAAGAPEGGDGGRTSPVPLRLLSTPAGRRLLDVLDAAVDAAEALDAERGDVLPGFIALQPGETRGTGYAEALSELRLRLRVEVKGPRGRD